MQFLNNVPLNRKLLLVTLGTCLPTLVLACAALFWFQAAAFRKSFADELASLGAIIAHNSAGPLAARDAGRAREALGALQVKPRIISARIFDESGNLFASVVNARAGGGAAGPANKLSEAEAGDEEDGGDAVLSLPIRLDETRSGRLELRARYDGRHRDFLTVYAMVLAAVVAGTLVLMVLIASRLQHVITGPIVDLAQVASTIGENQDYSSRALVLGRDEVGVLNRAFNRMLDQIETRDARLRASQQRYELAVQGSSDGLWDWDLVTNEVYFSPRWKSMLGWAEGELANCFETFRNLLHPGDVDHVLARVQDYLRGAQSMYEVEFRARHKSGRYLWILSRGVAVWDAEGTPLRFAGAHTDITGRKRAEEEICRAREKFESLVNSIHGIVWEVDVENLQRLFVNDKVEDLLGYPAGFWLEDAEFWLKTLHPEDREEAVAACRQGIAAGKPYQMEYRAAAADGRVLWLRESVSVVTEQGKPRSLRGVAIDITEQKLAGEQITRMQRELVDASRLAGMAEVATGVLHNVGNVLNSVNVSAALVVDQLRKSKTASLVKAVKMLREHEGDMGDFLSKDQKGKQLPVFLEAVAEHLAKEQASLSKETRILQENIEHIKQIVAMQQSYAKVSGTMEKLAVEQLVEDALRMSAAGLAKHGVEVVREYGKVEEVLADRHKVLQILVNLVNNAKHALEGRKEGKRLELRIGESEEGRVRVEVKDNGVGIEKGNLTRIFNHGFTTKRNGHGFGLHSGANAAKEMGGSLEAMSDGPGEGATFRLELPATGDRAREPILDLGGRSVGAF